MDWIIIGSIVLNIVAILSYLKVPDFLQSFFVKRIDHNFNERMNEIQYEQEKELNRIQSEFQKERQKMEHDFQVNLNTMKKKKEILPELYKKIMFAYSHYVFGKKEDRSNKDKFAKEGIFYLAEVRNFLTFEKFFMSPPIYNQVKEFDELTIKLIAIEHPEYLSNLKDISHTASKELEIERIEVHKQLKVNIDGLEKLIHDELNN